MSVAASTTIEDLPGGGSSIAASPTNRISIINDSQQSLSVLDIREIWSHRDLLYFLMVRDIKVRYKQAAMGAAWAIIQPLAIMFIFAVFFGIFIGVPTDGMPHTLFFYSALVPWMFFSSAVIAGSLSLVSSSNLVTKVYFPRIIVPAAAVGGLLIDLVITCSILVFIAIYYGTLWNRHVVAFPVMILLSILLALEFSIWLSAMTVKYRDIRHVLPFALQLWMFLTPIMYPLSVVPAKWRWLMYLNPLTGIAENLRSSVTGNAFNFAALSFTVAIACLMVPISIGAFHRIEKTFADLI